MDGNGMERIMSEVGVELAECRGTDIAEDRVRCASKGCDGLVVTFESGTEIEFDHADLGVIETAMAVTSQASEIAAKAPQIEPTLGTCCGDGAPLPIDVDTLLASRLLVQASSGGGKSWALRRLLEQIYRFAPQIIIDPEGEFATLKDKFRYVLCTDEEGADIPLSSISPAVLATELFRSGLSAIIDLSDYDFEARLEFVAEFVQALVDAPRDIWKPVVVVIDEAHLFAPQRGDNTPQLKASRRACIDLTARGRKRGLCPVMATQRLAKLHKDIAAELNNKLIGRTLLDIDLTRAADELGMAFSAARELLGHFGPGEFVALGPAFGSRISNVKVGPVVTRHGMAFQRWDCADLGEAEYQTLLDEINAKAKRPEPIEPGAAGVLSSTNSAAILQLVPKSTLALPLPTGTRFGSLPARERKQIRELTLAMMAPPYNRSAPELHEVLGLPLGTLYSWRSNAQLMAEMPSR